MRTLMPALAGMVAVIVAVPVAAFTVSPGSSRAFDGRGPVQFIAGETEVQAASVTATVDQLVVFGANVVRNRSDQPVVLDEAELTGEVGELGAHVVAVRVMDPADNGNDLVGAARWPFENYRALSEPIDGYELGPRQLAAVLFIVKVERPGDWQWRTTQVEYTADGRRFRTRSGFGFMVCAPATRRCDPALH
jgi:hypothetical protein